MATEETTITELELAEEVLADMVIPVDTSTDTKSVSLKQLRAWLGSSLPTGFIIASFGKMDDERFTLLDGKTLSKQGTYGAFCAKVEAQVQAGKWYACSEEEYNADLLASGQCSKFVIGVDYVRIPKLGNSLCSGVVDGKIPVFGNGMALGVTDGSGNFGVGTNGGQNGTYAFMCYNQIGENVGNENGNVASSTKNKLIGITTDPTKSGIEGKINSVEVFYYMVISTEGQTAKVEIDINQVYEDLNLKANSDLSNVASVASSFKEASVGWGMPDFSAGVDIPNNVYTQLPVDAFVSMKGAISGDYIYGLNISLNGVDTLFEIYTESIYGTGVAEYLPKGMYVKPLNANIYARYYPLKGVN